MPAKFPPRLHVLLARDTPYAVILRRGPSNTTCSIGWDRRKDTFTTGQWLRGRIYERRSDISPDGKHLIYFAMNGRWTSETGGSWTAISKAPYLKAMTLLGKGDCWHGGGLFLTNTRYWLNDGYGHKSLLVSYRFTRDETWQPSAYYGGECLHVYFNRLQRDGWTLPQISRLTICGRCSKNLPAPGGFSKNTVTPTAITPKAKAFITTVTPSFAPTPPNISTAPIGNGPTSTASASFGPPVDASTPLTLERPGS